MSVPNPVTVTQATAVVQINPLQSPYTPVLLNTVVYPGQVVSVIDTTSSFGALTTPIVVSTLINNSFLDGSISTLINQPQGFVTVQSYSTNKWAFLNSFPFRNQTVSAGLLNLTTSTLFTALTSTTFEVVNSLTVENLTVTGNFLQSQGITLNTNLSTLGSVEFLSSVVVYGTSYFSSAVSTIGAVNLYSSLRVTDSFSTRSSLTTASSFYVSGSLMALGPLSTSALQLKDGLVGTSLEVQTSSPSFVSLAGSLLVSNLVSTLSSVTQGGFLRTTTTDVGSFTALSSASFFQQATVSSFTSTSKTLSTTGSLGVGGLFTGSNVTVGGDILVFGNASVQENLTIGTSLTVSSLTATTLETVGNYTNPSTLAQISSLSLQTNLGAQTLSSGSLLIGSTFEVQTNLWANALAAQTFLRIPGGVSSLSFVSSGQEALVEGGISTLGTLSVQGLLSTGGKATVSASTITSLQTLSTAIHANLQGLGNLYCDGTLTISSITLPSSLLANSFTAGQTLVGTYAISKEYQITELIASSVTFGYLQNSVYPFDLSGSLFLDSTIPIAVILSTGVLSTSVYDVPLNPNSYLRVSSGMGVNTIPDPDTFVSQPLSYFLSSPLLVASTLSTNFVLANQLQGALKGDASMLSNFSYPLSVSVNRLLVNGQFLINQSQGPGSLTTSSLQVSSGNVYTSFLASTLNVGAFEMRGNQWDIEFGTGRNLLQVSTNTLVLNDVQFVKLNANASQVFVNLQGMIDQPYYTDTLSVFSSLAFTEAKFDANLSNDRFYANKIITGSITSKVGTATSVTISSGTISTLTAPFFIGEQQPYTSRYNLIQPYQSTLQFNSTLFVNREFSSVGINTKPNFNLDAEAIYVDYAANAGQGSVVQNQIVFSTTVSTLYFAFVNSNATTSNTVFANAPTGPWQNYTLGSSQYVYKSYFSPGFSLASNTGSGSYVSLEKMLPQYFMGTQVFSETSFGPLLRRVTYDGYQLGSFPASYTANAPDSILSMATDGTAYFFTGTLSPAQQSNTPTAGTLFSNANIDDPTFTFSNVNSSIFPSFPTSNYERGGRSIVYGGLGAPAWVAVGVGNTGPIWRSVDGGINWTVNNIGLYDLYSVLATPLPLNGGNVFLAGGTFLTQLPNTTYQQSGGYVFSSTDLGATWTCIGSNFSGPVRSLATNGQVVVAGVSATAANETLYYSPLTFSNTYSWEQCSGSLFPTSTNTVIWTGTQFVAGGNDGIRTSLDGITWVNPGSFSQTVNNLGFTSNAATMISLVNNGLSLLLQDTPNLQCQRILSTPTLSVYPSSILNLNNACILDEAANVVAMGSINTPSPLFGLGFQSTFYATRAFVSSFLSTASLLVGAYTLGIQSV